MLRAGLIAHLVILGGFKSTGEMNNNCSAADLAETEGRLVGRWLDQPVTTIDQSELTKAPTRIPSV